MMMIVVTMALNGLAAAWQPGLIAHLPLTLRHWSVYESQWIPARTAIGATCVSHGPASCHMTSLISALVCFICLFETQCVCFCVILLSVLHRACWCHSEIILTAVIHLMIITRNIKIKKSGRRKRKFHPVNRFLAVIVGSVELIAFFFGHAGGYQKTRKLLFFWFSSIRISLWVSFNRSFTFIMMPWHFYCAASWILEILSHTDLLVLHTHWKMFGF